MNIFETIRTALESLSSNKLRTLLTMLGVIIGVSSVVALLSIGAGVSSLIGGSIRNIGSNIISVSPGFNSTSARLTNSDVDALADPRNVPGLSRVVPEVRGNAVVASLSSASNRTTSVAGTTADFFVMRNVTLSEGELFTENDVLLRSRVAVLGSSIASTLFPSGSATGQQVLIGSVTFRVLGVAATKGGFGANSTDDNVYVPITIAQEKLFVNRSTGLKSVSTIYVEVESTQATQSTVDDITAALRTQHNLLPGQSDDFRVFNQAEIAATLDTVTTALTAFLGAIGGIALFVGGIGIMNIMLVSVTERTKEIGLRKAVGARRRTILMQFLIEALTVSSLAGLIGLGVGVGASLLIGQVQTTLTPSVQPNSLLISFGFSVLVGVVFGLYPAWRASRLQPVEALRYE